MQVLDLQVAELGNPYGITGFGFTGRGPRIQLAREPSPGVQFRLFTSPLTRRDWNLDLGRIRIERHCNA